MGTFRVTFNFTSETGQAWSESWYNTQGSNVSAVAPAAEDLAAKRARLIGLGNTLDSWKITDVENERLTLYRDPFAGFLVTADAATDVPVSSQLGIVTTVPELGRRQFFCRGIPDSWVVFNPDAGIYTLIGAFQTAFQTFAKAITAGPWSLQVRDPVSADAGLSDVTSVAPQLVTGRAQLTLAAGGGFTGEDDLILGGFRYPLQFLNGTYLSPRGYSLTGGTTLVLSNRYVSAFQASAYNAGGTARALNYTYPPITQCRYSRPGDRKVGKNSALPRGRRSSR